MVGQQQKYHKIKTCDNIKSWEDWKVLKKNTAVWEPSTEEHLRRAKHD